MGRAARIVAPRAQATAQLVCFAHAGGGEASYYGWIPRLPPWVELITIEAPGRGRRSDESAAMNVAEVVERNVSDLAKCIRLPYATFGHSFGAHMAYRYVRSSEGLIERPSVMIQSAAQPLWRLQSPFALDDENLIRWMLKNGGGAEVLAHPSILERALVNLRADLHLLRDPDLIATHTVDVPIATFAGQDDTIVTPSLVSEWANLTTAGCEHHLFPGGHFFHQERRDEVLQAIQRIVRPYAEKMSL